MSNDYLLRPDRYDDLEHSIIFLERYFPFSQNKKKKKQRDFPLSSQFAPQTLLREREENWLILEMSCLAGGAGRLFSPYTSFQFPRNHYLLFPRKISSIRRRTQTPTPTILFVACVLRSPPPGQFLHL